MMRQKNLLLILSIVFLIFTSCKKNDGIQSGNLNVNDDDLNPVVTKTQHRHVEMQLVGSYPVVDFEQIVFEYTSVGPDMQTPIRLTGVISMPTAVYEKTENPQTLMLYNEFTTAKHNERTSGDEVADIALYLNPYQGRITVSADLYGWTNTEDKPQAYCCTEISARETIDCWDAAMIILKQKGYAIDDLPMYNLGYSSGALDAMAVQRYVDANRPDIQFVVTAVGGGPYDLAQVYKTYVETDTTGYICSLPLMLVAYKETFNLDFEYSDVFRKPLCDSIQSWILSKAYSTQEINDLIGRDHHISEILTDVAYDTTSALGQLFLTKFRENSVCGVGQNWQPSTKTQYYVMHSPNDLYIDYLVGVEMADYLENRGCTVIRDFSNVGNHVEYGLLAFIGKTLLLCQPELTSGASELKSISLELTNKSLQ